MKTATLVLFGAAVVGGVPTYMTIQEKLCFCSSTIEAAENFSRNTSTFPLETFRAHLGRYPATSEGFAALLAAPKGAEARWNGPYIEGSKIPLDPWGREYQYRSPGLKNPSGYDLWSLGPDGISSADDIGNWSK